MALQWATLAPIRLTNAAAQLVLRTQVRRKEKRPHPTPHNPRPYATMDASPWFVVEPNNGNLLTNPTGTGYTLLYNHLI